MLAKKERPYGLFDGKEVNLDKKFDKFEDKKAKNITKEFIKPNKTQFSLKHKIITGILATLSFTMSALMIAIIFAWIANYN